MKYLITGGSGLVGSKLIKELLDDGHEVVNLSRSSRSSDKKGLTQVKWDGSTIPESVGPVNVVVNLAGANVGQRWTEAHKELIYSSRVKSTRACVKYINSQDPKPQVFISASGSNYYGDDEQKAKTEEDGPGTGFLSKVCVAWENETKNADTRTVIMRIPPILSTDGGPLEKLLTPFKMFVGGPTGSGDQPFPWAHLDDIVRAIRFFSGKKSTHGPYNLAAPESVTNKEFANTLGNVLHRPSFFRIPKFALDIIFGEMAVILWGGLNINSDKIQNEGFEFKFPTLKSALVDLLV